MPAPAVRPPRNIPDHDASPVPASRRQRVAQLTGVMRRWFRRRLRLSRPEGRPDPSANASPDTNLPPHDSQTPDIPLNGLHKVVQLSPPNYHKIKRRPVGQGPPLPSPSPSPSPLASQAESIGAETEASAVFTAQTAEVTDNTSVSNSWLSTPEPLDLGGRHYKAKRGIYVGRPERIQPPSDVEAYFKSIEDRICGDLREYGLRHPVPRSRSPYVLENLPAASIGLSGRVVGGMISLQPTVIIRCHNPKAMARVISSSHLLDWVQDEEPRMGPHLVLKQPIFKALDAASAAPDAGGPRRSLAELRLDGNLGLLFRIGFLPGHLDQDSVHGAICRAALWRNGSRVVPMHSRLGGLVEINGRLMGVTTAHQIFDGFWRGGDDQRRLDSQSNIDDVDESEEESEEEDDDDKDGGARVRDDDVLSRQIQQITDWPRATISKGIVLNFAGYHLQAFDKRTTSEAAAVLESDADAASDFALFQMDDGFHMQSPVKTWRRMAESCRPCEVAASLCTLETVEILLGDKSVEATVCPDNGGKLLVCGRRVPTRLLGLRSPLPSGSSGAWVFRGEDLCGMIVAGYEDEPYVHILEAKQLLEDIHSSFPGGASVRFLRREPRSIWDTVIVNQGQSSASHESPTNPAAIPMISASPKVVAGDDRRRDNIPPPKPASFISRPRRSRSVKSYIARSGGVVVDLLGRIILTKRKPSKDKDGDAAHKPLPPAAPPPVSNAPKFDTPVFNVPGYAAPVFPPDIRVAELAATGQHLSPIPAPQPTKSQHSGGAADDQSRLELPYHYNSIPFESLEMERRGRMSILDQMEDMVAPPLEVTGPYYGTIGRAAVARPVEYSDHITLSAATSVSDTRLSARSASIAPRAGSSSSLTSYGPRKEERKAKEEDAQHELR